MNTFVTIARVITLLLFGTFTIAAISTERGRPAVPINAIEGILDAFHSHEIVALGEGGHTNEQAHAFRLALIRDPRFPAIVNDIVVEFGNARYQDLMDRFVRGENVPTTVLRQVWQNTTQSTPTWDVPIYEEFFHAVRTINAGLPKEKKLRVLLGDPPVDWSSKRTIQEQIRDYGSRDEFPFQVVRPEVLAKKQRALLIFGDGHFYRRPEDPRRRGLIDEIEATGAKVFSIQTNTAADLEKLQASISSWPMPSLALIRGTGLELADFKTLPYPSNTVEAANGHFDALLYLGHPLTITYSRVTKTLCEDDEYVRMRAARRADRDFAVKFRARCELPQPVLPQLWRTYISKGVGAMRASAPTTGSAYAGGASDLYRLAQAMLQRRKFDDAIATLEMNVTIFPRDVLSLNTVAEACLAKGDLEDYLRSYQRTLAINKNDKTARHALGLDRQP